MTEKLLIIGFVWPEPKSSAAGSRMMQLIEVFQKGNYQITFATACAKNINAFDLKSIGVNVVDIALNDASFDGFVKQLNPDLVLFDRFMVEEQFGWRVAEQCPNALRILDTEDLHCLRKGRQQAFKDKKPFDASYLFNEVAKRELASIYRCDLSLIISEVEMSILKNQFKVDPSLLYYLPFLVNPISDAVYQNLPEFHKRHHFVTIGNFLHAPNYQAVLYLKQHIWPSIKKQLPECEMHVYGAYSSQKVDQLNNIKEGFLIKGFADDVKQVMEQARVCLAPLQFGAGLKGKLVDAMKNGTPCVTTTVGAEGLYGNLSPNGFIVNDPKTFALKAVELYTNQNVWQVSQVNGFEIINSRFDKTQFQMGFLETLKQLKAKLSQHRENNFMGSMLHHHTLQSTKYMAKWIEAKNRTSK